MRGTSCKRGIKEHNIAVQSHKAIDPRRSMRPKIPSPAPSNTDGRGTNPNWETFLKQGESIQVSLLFLSPPANTSREGCPLPSAKAARAADVDV